MEGYISLEADTREAESNLTKDLAESEEEESEEELLVSSSNNQPWQEKYKAMRKLKEGRKKPTRNEKVSQFKKLCEEKSIPYLEDNKTHIEMLLSAGMLVLQTYILASITIMNMVQSSIIENEVVHDILGGLMDKSIRWQHYCSRVCHSHKVDTRLQAIFEPYKSLDVPDAFNNKLDVIYDEALTRYMLSEQEAVDGGSNAKKSV